ncbi:hypothetical protein J437_LFUL000930 [Ladona fulva]|uniref:5-formyltetrahydrofolate cyclo-ligase n=1 Tax=Ladona fulva TaxID=123851 RepID=A0A8K0K8D0_LADFU|nr:hypothetical protein J437_LFUL000930 [Ladona fulva]
MGTIRSAKTALRLEIKKKIQLMNSDQKVNQSKLVTEKVINSQYFKESNRISIYISRSDEVQTFDLLRKIFDLGKLCFVPRYSTESNHMDMVRLYSIEEVNNFSKTKWNITQPDEEDERENALSTGGLDLIFVPGMAFSKAGKRLGRGKGFYDKFLKECIASQRVPATTVGLAFDEQIFQDIPTDLHDFKLDIIVYPYD